MSRIQVASVVYGALFGAVGGVSGAISVKSDDSAGTRAKAYGKGGIIGVGIPAAFASSRGLNTGQAALGALGAFALVAGAVEGVRALRS